MVKIHDISNNGISFYATQGFAYDGAIIDLRFMDQVGDRTYDIGVEAQVVRTVKTDKDTELYGCKFRLQNREVLTYICMRKLMDKKLEKMRESELDLKNL